MPWFVAWVDGEPEFRAMDGRKFVRAVRERLCWVCGERLSKVFAFVVGPMCAVNRTSAEPPSHLDCADWSVRGCPFLSRPHMVRREAGLPDQAQPPAGIGLGRNPGVTLIWITKAYRMHDAGNGHVIRMGDPTKITAWAEGRAASADELEHSIATGLPALREIAEMEGAHAVRRLEQQTSAARRLLKVGR